MFAWRWFGFVVGSAGIIWLSRGSLRDRTAHGFYRFFAFEAILGLILLNVPAWFHDPFSPRQLVSWTLLLISLWLAVHGFYLLHHTGKPDGRIQDATRLGVEKTTRLVRTGAYHYIRHPLYSSLLSLTWGVYLKDPSWSGTLLAGAATVAVYLTARVEEQENLRNFGLEYAEYMRQTRMFIPGVF